MVVGMSGFPALLTERCNQQAGDYKGTVSSFASKRLRTDP
jgi:hypothetical protein